MDLQISCVNKTYRTDPHDLIHSVGGPGWKITQQQAIAHIESGTHRFYVSAGGQVAWVVVAVSRYNNKYLKTQNDGEQPDNLLSLLECP